VPMMWPQEKGTPVYLHIAGIGGGMCWDCWIERERAYLPVSDGLRSRKGQTACCVIWGYNVDDDDDEDKDGMEDGGLGGGLYKWIS
jgi:hypothetical protein